MVCSKCGKQNPDRAAFCSYCGTQQKAQLASAKKSNAMAVLLGIVFLLVFIVYCVTGLSIPEMFQAVGQMMSKERPAKPALYDFERALTNKETSFRYTKISGTRQNKEAACFPLFVKYYFKDCYKKLDSTFL